MDCILKSNYKVNEIGTNTNISEEVDEELVHQEILNGLEIKGNESGMSDLDSEYEEIQKKKKVFNIYRSKKIISKEINDSFIESQKDKIFNPLNLFSISEEKEKEKTEDLKKENEDPYENCISLQRKRIIVKPKKKIFSRTHPFLKSFRPKFLKRENIDKRILRKFRNFVLEKYTQDKYSFNNYDSSFWEDFYKKNLLPPTKYNERNGKIKNFKSFGAKYELWLFRKKGTFELFNEFIKKCGENVYQSFITDYGNKIKKEENIKDKLYEYIKLFPKIYYFNNEEKRRKDSKIKRKVKEIKKGKESFTQTINNGEEKITIEDKFETLFCDYEENKSKAFKIDFDFDKPEINNGFNNCCFGSKEFKEDNYFEEMEKIRNTQSYFCLMNIQEKPYGAFPFNCNYSSYENYFNKD